MINYMLGFSDFVVSTTQNYHFFNVFCMNYTNLMFYRSGAIV